MLARYLVRHCVDDVPERLSHDLPVPRTFTDPRLLIAQCCGYDLVYGFASTLRIVATPCYAAPGCTGGDYRSCVLVRTADDIRDLEALRGRTCVVNGYNSHSGANALRALVAPLSRGGRFFAAVKVSGAHRRSLELLRAGEADVMAMDGVLHALLERHRPDALAGTRALCWSEAAPAPPFITAATTEDALVERLLAALVDGLADDASREARDALMLDGVTLRPIEDYVRILECEGKAHSRGYYELHATSPVRTR